MSLRHQSSTRQTPIYIASRKADNDNNRTDPSGPVAGSCYCLVPDWLYNETGFQHLSLNSLTVCDLEGLQG